jgi:hypothetical protein
MYICMTMYIFKYGSRRLMENALLNRVARWYIFEPKILIWVNLVGP